jgi:hypothetical protein
MNSNIRISTFPQAGAPAYAGKPVTTGLPASQYPVESPVLAEIRSANRSAAQSNPLDGATAHRLVAVLRKQIAYVPAASLAAQTTNLKAATVADLLR